MQSLQVIIHLSVESLWSLYLIVCKSLLFILAEYTSSHLDCFFGPWWVLHEAKRNDRWGLEMAIETVHQ